MEADIHLSACTVDSPLIRDQIVEGPPYPAVFSGAGPPDPAEQTRPHCPQGH